MSVFVDPAYQYEPTRIQVDIELPPGDYIMDAVGSTVLQITYAYDANMAYPFVEPGIMEITGSSIGNQYFANFFDWEVTGLSCESQRADANVVLQTPIQVDLGMDTSTCLSYTITPSITGTFTWSTGDTGPELIATTTGTYSVVAVDTNGCSSVDTVVVTLDPANQVDLGPDVEACVSATLDAGGVAGNSYNWSTGDMTQTAEVTASGMYTVEVTEANGCVTMDSVNVIINTVDVSTTVSLPEIASNAFGAYYEWIDCNTMTTIAGEQDRIIEVTENGSYAVVVTQNGCVDTSACEVVASINIETVDTNLDFSFYPNPTKGELTLDLGSYGEDIIVDIFDASGRLVSSNTYNNAYVINLEMVGEPGVYFMVLRNQNERLGIHKVIKE